MLKNDLILEFYFSDKVTEMWEIWWKKCDLGDCGRPEMVGNRNLDLKSRTYRSVFVIGTPNPNPKRVPSSTIRLSRFWVARLMQPKLNKLYQKESQLGTLSQSALSKPCASLSFSSHAQDRKFLKFCLLSYL